MEQYLAQCLASILQQTHRDLEIIIIDDGSPDNSKAIYTRPNPRIKIIAQAHSGVAAARNAGLAQASGDYVHFVDGDDYLVGTNYYAKMLEAALKTNADIAVSGFYWEGRAIDFTNAQEKPLENTQAKINELCKFPSVWRYLYKRSLLKSVRFQTDITGGEDTILAVQAAYAAQQMVLVPETTYFYRKNLQSIILSRDPVKIKILETGTQKAWEIISQFAQENNFDVSGLNRWIPIRASRFEVTI